MIPRFAVEPRFQVRLQNKKRVEFIKKRSHLNLVSRLSAKVNRLML